MENQEILNKILTRLENIENLLQFIADKQIGGENSTSELNNSSSLDIVSILQNIDENLIPTIRALFVLKNGGTAEQIASKTGRSRTRENQHLNKLTKLHYVEKIRNGREVIFQLKN